jgi:hypothetical protein
VRSPFRSCSRRGRTGTHATAAGRLALSVCATLALSLCAGVAPAGAIISGGFGLQSRAKQSPAFAPLQYHGGPVLHSSDSYAIYWDPTGTYRGDWKRLINTYLQNVGADSGTHGNVFAVDAQYTDTTGRAANRSTFRGGYTDTDPYPTSENCTELDTYACLTDQQIQAELQHVIASGALPGATGPAVYYLLTPPGVTVCTGSGSAETCSNSSKLKTEPNTGICGYHSAIDPGGANPVIYAVQPWVAGDAGLIIENQNPLVTSESSEDVFACQDSTNTLEEPNQLAGLNPFGNYAEGLADVIINDLSIEQSDIVVDPLLNGWYQNGTNSEQGDMCQWSFGPPPEKTPTPDPKTHAASTSNETIAGGNYYLQWAFNSVGVTSRNEYSCWSGVTLEPHFTAPNPVNAGDVVGFDASESDVTLAANVKGLPPDEPFTAPVYRWNFGDGTVVSGTGAISEFHSYQYGGEYEVTLTITDSGGATEKFGETITVDGPARPSSGGSGSGGSGSGGSGPGGTSDGSAAPGTGVAGGASTPGIATKPTVPGPVATQTVLSSSLSKTMGKGLVIRYSVNQQATGHFEVLLAASTAHRLGLHGPLAAGLPQGTPAQVVIAKALLVTTKAGRNTLKIQFGKVTAKRLRRLHSVPLTLRLILRNAGGGTTTVLSKLTLH